MDVSLSEALYLVAKLLRNCGEFNETSAVLERELVCLIGFYCQNQHIFQHNINFHF